MPSQNTITGVVLPANATERVAMKVQAFDHDMPSVERRAGSAPQMLGEAITDAEGRFTITYTLEQFQSDEGISTFRRSTGVRADLSFRIFDDAGRELTIKSMEALDREYRADQIIFNVPTPVGVSLVLDAPPEVTGTSEYEQLIAQLAPVTQDVPLSELSDEDLSFLTNELGLEQQRDVQQRIEWLRRCALLAQETNLPVEAYYGWGRKDLPAQFTELAAVPLKNLPAVLEKLTGLRAEKLRDTLLAAIDGNIIPAEFRTRVDDIIRQLIRRGQDLVPVNARLVDEETGAPLAGYSVATIDKDAQGENLGLDITDQGGGFFFTFYQPRGLPATTPARQFSFKVITPEGDALAESAPTAITPNNSGIEVVSIKIKVPKPSVPSLAEQLQDAKILAPPAVLDWLKSKGISTFVDIRRKGGLSKVDGAPPGDPALIRRLDSLADLDRVSASAQVSTAILDKGYDSVLAIADAPYSEFVSLVSDEKTALTEMDAAKLHVMATTQTNLLNEILIRMAVDKANGFELPSEAENQTGANA